MSKLEHYGVKGEAINLTRSYLHQRQQLVDFNGCLSDMRYIETGVPQGSVLGLGLAFLFDSNRFMSAFD